MKSNYRQSQHQQQLVNQVRHGTVIELSGRRAKVAYGQDVDGAETHSDWLPWLLLKVEGWAICPNGKRCKVEAWTVSPQVGDAVAILAPSGNLAAGVVVGSFE